MRNYLVSQGYQNFDYSKGILQAIGFKEFAPYFEWLKRTQSPASSTSSYISTRSNLSNNSENNNPNGDNEERRTTMNQCVEDLKTRTRNYGRAQLKWISNRFQALPIHFLYSDGIIVIRNHHHQKSIRNHQKSSLEIIT